MTGGRKFVTFALETEKKSLERNFVVIESISLTLIVFGVWFQDG